MITLEEFAELKADMQELDRLRKQYKELKARSVVGASSVSYGYGRGGYSDRVYARVAALDEVEHELRTRKHELLNRIQHPIYGYCFHDDLPDAQRVWDILYKRCQGESWDSIARTYGIKTASCKNIIRRYEKQLKKLTEEPDIYDTGKE